MSAESLFDPSAILTDVRLRYSHDLLGSAATHSGFKTTWGITDVQAFGSEDCTGNHYLLEKVTSSCVLFVHDDATREPRGSCFVTFPSSER